ncbi:hypothetical protein U9M48_043421 [Paspalum notatum var. saurae]|uniref:Nodulin-related protein 1 n=1 Tax=Paspalum notatum var. saurae TaxID=547442 RepID=A0AAQ3USQ4_PASNO
MAEEKSSGDLFSSGKLVAEAAVSVFQKKSTDNVDKQEVAGAAADLLHAASTYGKFEDKPAGQYIEKAEGYLKEFRTGSEKEKADAPPPAPAGGDEQKPAEAVEAPKDRAPAPAAEEGKPEGFGLDDVMKGAEQLVGNQGQGEGEKSAGGSAGGLFKMAQGFLK